MEEHKSSNNPQELRKAARKLVERIRKADEVNSLEIDESFRVVMDRVKDAQSRSKSRRLYGWVASVAAAVGIFLVVNWWWGFSDPHSEKTSTLKAEMREIVVPEGKRLDAILSDGTKIYVNSGSKVIYPDVFDEEKREIHIEGEVYLDVAKNPDCPFIVKTRDFDISVLGTAFNVCAYSNETSASVVLVHGSVLVTTENKHKIQLEPNQLINIKGGETSICEVDVAEYISWKDNMLLANRKSLADIFRKLELYYGCKIQYDPKIVSMSLTGKLDLLPEIKDVIENLCLSFPLRYEVNDSNEIYVSLK